MKHISVLVPKGDVVVGSIEGPYKLFTHVNEFLQRDGKQPGFTIELIGQERETLLDNGIYKLNTHRTLRESFKTDLIIIPAVHGDQRKVIRENQDMIQWITGQYKRGAEVASLCVGAFILASTGLLEGEALRNALANGQRFPKDVSGNKSRGRKSNHR